jgi:hypothetical protein
MVLWQDQREQHLGLGVSRAEPIGRENAPRFTFRFVLFFDCLPILQQLIASGFPFRWLSRLRPVSTVKPGTAARSLSIVTTAAMPTRLPLATSAAARSNTPRLRSRCSAAIPVSRMNRFIGTCPHRPRRRDRCRVDSASYPTRQGPPPRRRESPMVASVP